MRRTVGPEGGVSKEAKEGRMRWMPPLTHRTSTPDDPILRFASTKKPRFHFQTQTKKENGESNDKTIDSFLHFLPQL